MANGTPKKATYSPVGGWKGGAVVGLVLAVMCEIGGWQTHQDLRVPYRVNFVFDTIAIIFCACVGKLAYEWRLRKRRG